METKLQLWWQKIRKSPLVVGIIVAYVLVIALIVVIIGGYLFNWEWTGVSGGANKVTTTMTTPGATSAAPGTIVATEQPPAKTLWDWIGLLGVLAIPVVVGFGAAWFTAQQVKVSERENRDNQREKALQDYINKMSELILVNRLSDPTVEGDAVQKIARVLTLTVLRGLDGRRKADVLLFLYESDLIDKDKPIVDLSGASVGRYQFLSAVLGANLDDASLLGANLGGAYLSRVSLRKAFLLGAYLSGADLRGANLSGANLSGADLRGANLMNASLHDADLRGVDLRGANLKDARGITGYQLNQVKSLEGATMPYGSIHP